MYLGIVLLGLFNGLVLLPILLYRWGPVSQESIATPDTLITVSKTEK